MYLFFHSGFEDMMLVLNVPVPGQCLYFTIYIYMIVFVVVPYGGHKSLPHIHLTRLFLKSSGDVCN